jgi:hypothetical protein
LIRTSCLSAGAMAAAVMATAAPGQASTLELNKLEPRDRGCRAYFVIGTANQSFQTFKVDLILFRKDGIVDRRVAVDLGPLRAGKTTVKTFDLDAASCDQIGTLLLNDVLDCKSDPAAPAGDCLADFTLSTRSAVEFKK